MIWSMPRFQHSIELFPRVLKEVAPLLLPISALLWGLELYMAILNKARFDNPYEASMVTMVVLGLTGVVLQSLCSVIYVLYVARSTQRQMKNGAGKHPLSFLGQHFHQTLIEYLRSLISIGLYTLCLILPGLIRWVQLTFTCLISAFDPQYQEGKKDALKESARLTRGAWFALLLLLVLPMMLTFVLQEFALGNYGLDKADDGSRVLSLSFSSLVFYGLAWLVQLYFAIYFSLTFFARHSLKLEKA